MIDSETKVIAVNLPRLLARYEGTTVIATGTKGVSGKTQMFKTNDSAAIFLTPDQTNPAYPY